MGVMIAMGVAGLAGGIMGGIGQQQQQQAQYAMQVAEANKQNYLQGRANDEANWQHARKAAITKLNNKKIVAAALKQRADMQWQANRAFEGNARDLGLAFMQQRDSLMTEAVGKNIRGGMADRMMNLADTQFAERRKQNRENLQASMEGAENQYNAMLNKRDTLTRQPTNYFVPGSMPPKPASGMTLDMLGSMLGGATSGASMGAGMQSNLGIKPFWEPKD